MVYEPRRKPDSKIIISIAICVVIALFSIVFFIKPGNEEEEILYQISGLSANETKELLETKAEDSYVFSDAFFYGETLSLLKEEYNPEEVDEISGRSILLKEVSSENEYSFVVGSTIDSGVNLSHLNEGFYEIYVVEDLIEKKAVLDETLVTSIKTTVQKDTRYEIKLIASQEYFKENNIQPKENYIYLEVKETTLNAEEYDIALDPAAYDYDFTWAVNEGSVGNGLKEYQESYKAAELLKTALEKKGYKVLIVRGKEEDLNSYGEDGRLYRAYKANCKYYFRLGFEESTFDYAGFDVSYSAHSSKLFANQIVQYMKKHSDVSISSVYSLGDNEGIYPSILIEGKDKRGVYDTNLWIREAGGKATNAGMYSDNAEKGTAFFAKNNIHGMYALYVNLGYLTNKKDVEFWKNNKETYMNIFAEAINDSLNIHE